MPKSKTNCIGILTAGGDCPGLNAAIRSVAKSALHYGMHVIGIYDGFRGLVENRTLVIEDKNVSGVLTVGGTLLGTSRDKPHKMQMGEKVMDMTEVAIANARRLQIECLVCMGGNGTQKNTLHLHEAGGINVLTLPKTIDNDVAETDISFGFDTAMAIAAEAIDRLHTTATSHHRVILCEIMGHNAGWLALGSGIAGGADIILIPEIPYDLNIVAEHLIARRRGGKKFSIIAVAEGAISQEEAQSALTEGKKPGKTKDKDKKKKKAAVLPAQGKLPLPLEDTESPETEDAESHLVQEPKASRLARQLQELTGTEARVTSLGHVQRGGIPSATDRLLCTRLGAKASQLLAEGVYNVMVAIKGDECVPVPLEKVAARLKTVPLNHPWIETAHLVGTCLGARLD